MASKGLQGFARSFSTLRSFLSTSNDPLANCLAPRLTRTMATEAPLPSSTTASYEPHNLATTIDAAFDPGVLTTIYKFPSMEPARFETYPSKHLHLPLRRDLLHRAVVFEGDATRQGTASIKTRWEIAGSSRKLRPQKGTGRARQGDRTSNILRGGTKSHGPRPRDFSTDLPKKMYDIAWRTALSYRWRKGALIVCEDGMDLHHADTDYAVRFLQYNGWGKNHGRTLMIPNERRKKLFEGFKDAGQHGIVELVDDVDVKDLLMYGRLLVEKSALDRMLEEHSSDLVLKAKSAAF